MTLESEVNFQAVNEMTSEFPTLETIISGVSKRKGEVRTMRIEGYIG